MLRHSDAGVAPATTANCSYKDKGLHVLCGIALISCAEVRTRRDFLPLAGKSLGLAALSSATAASLLRNVEARSRCITPTWFMRSSAGRSRRQRLQVRLTQPPLHACGSGYRLQEHSPQVDHCNR
jgi:hypothetical protein